MTPLLVSKSTIAIGSPKLPGARSEYCLSDTRLKPVMNIKPHRKNIARLALLPSWPIASCYVEKLIFSPIRPVPPMGALLTSSTSPVRGLIILIFLSLHVVTNLLPSQFQQALYMISGWQSICMSNSPVPTFHNTTWLSEPTSTFEIRLSTDW